MNGGRSVTCSIVLNWFIFIASVKLFESQSQVHRWFSTNRFNRNYAVFERFPLFLANILWYYIMSAFLRQERVVFFFERVRKKKKNTSTHQLVLLLIFSLIIYSNQTRSTQTDRINSLDGNWRRSVFRLLRIIDIINITFSPWHFFPNREDFP